MVESMSEIAPELRIFGTRGSPAAYTIRDFLQRSDVPFRWIELTSDDQAHAEAGVAELSDAKLPVCVFPMVPGWNGLQCDRSPKSWDGPESLAGGIRSGDLWGRACGA